MVECLDEPDTPGHLIVQLMDVARKRAILGSGNKVHRIGQGHTGIIHSREVPKEVGQGVFQALDTPLFLEIEKRKGHDADKHAQHGKVIYGGRFEEYRHTIRPHHVDEPANKDQQSERDADDQDIFRSFGEHLDGMLHKPPDPLPGLALLLEFGGDLGKFGFYRGQFGCFHLLLGMLAFVEQVISNIFESHIRTPGSWN